MVHIALIRMIVVLGYMTASFWFVWSLRERVSGFRRAARDLDSKGSRVLRFF